MKLSTAFFLLAILCAAVYQIYRRRIEATFTVREEISVGEVMNRADAFLRRQPTNGSYLVFLADQIGDDGGASFTQLSVEDGEIGIDHVFTADLNRRTAERFEQLLRGQGLVVNRLMGNSVEYLRAPTNDGPTLVYRVLTEVFGVERDGRVGVLERVRR